MRYSRSVTYDELTCRISSVQFVVWHRRNLQDTCNAWYYYRWSPSHECNEICHAVYSNKWYLVTGKSMLTILLRGTKPVYLTARKVFPLTMATFCNVDFEWAIYLNRVSLDLIGLWPKSAENRRQKLLCDLRVFVVFMGLIFAILFPSIHALIKIYGDVMLMIDNLQFTLPAISCSIRIIIFWWKKEAIIPIVNMIAEDWVTSKSIQERAMMIRSAQTARIIITCAYCIMGVACLFIIVMPGFGITMRLTTNVTDPGKPMPLQTYYIYDITETPQYELTFASQAFYIVIAIMCYTGIDNFLGLLIFHISGQMDILKNRLAHMHKDINFHDMLKNCVIKHIRLLRAIAVIEDTYNVTLLALFLYFAMLFALYGFRIISLFDEDNDLSLFYLVYFTSNIFNLFAHMCLHCVLGEILVAQCNGIYYAAYSNKWYTIHPKFAKELLPLLIRGTKPIYLTAGKVFPMTMATFCNLIKTSAGYISVLHTTRK